MIHLNVPYHEQNVVELRHSDHNVNNLMQKRL